jgi:hypothetical protein
MELNLEKLVQDRLDNLDLEHMVKGIVRDVISAEVRAQVKPIIEKEVTQIIAEEIKKVFTTETIIDYGWGSREVFPTFEALFKKQFKAKLDSQYEVKKIISDLVKERVTSLINQDYAKVVETIVDTLTASKLVKK